MNAALTTTTVDLARSLQQLLFGGAIENQVQAAAKRAASQLVQSNKADHPDIRGKVTRTGPLSYSIELTAPGLWTTVFGTASQEENNIVTHLLPVGSGIFPTIRGGS